MFVELYENLISGILEEGISAVKQKYGDKVPEEIIDELAEIDKTPQKKYLEWMVRMYLKGVKDLEKFKIVNDFEELLKKNKIPSGERDIYRYKSLEDLNSVVQKYSTVKSKSEQKRIAKVEGAEKVFENDKAVVYLIKSYEASCLIGANTKWCTTSRGSPATFYQYYRRGNLYYVIDKVNNKKYAVYVDRAGEMSFYDELDNDLSEEEAREIFSELGVPL